MIAVGPDGASPLWFPRFLVDASRHAAPQAPQGQIKRTNKHSDTVAGVRRLSQWVPPEWQRGSHHHDAPVRAWLVLDDTISIMNIGRHPILLQDQNKNLDSFLPAPS